jgi:hypothetical protein
LTPSRLSHPSSFSARNLLTGLRRPLDEGWDMATHEEVRSADRSSKSFRGRVGWGMMQKFCDGKNINSKQR